MEVDLSLIGTAEEPFVVEVEKGAIRLFAKALKDPNPFYQDEDFARALGYASLVAPPTFPATFRPPVRQIWLRNLDYARILAGEQGFAYRRPIVAGDILHCRMHLVEVEQKQGRSGPMQKIVQELRASDPQGVLVVTNRRVVMYRAAPVRATP